MMKADRLMARHGAERGLAIPRTGQVRVCGASVIVLLLAACGSSTEHAAMVGSPPAMAVQIHVLHAEPLDYAFTTTGTLLPNEEVELRSEVSGRVTHIGFQEGANVSAGQVLVRINDDDLQAQLRKAESGLRVAQDSEDRQKKLVDLRSIFVSVHN